MKKQKAKAATKRGVVLESVVRRPRPSLFPQKVRGGITEAWYYEYADHLEFYHDGPGKVSTFSVPLWMLQKSLARCKPNPAGQDRPEKGGSV